MIKIAINGFGRIGRQALKIALEKENIEVVAINDLSRADMLAHLLKYDTAQREYTKEVKAYIGDREFIAGSAELLDLDKEFISSADSRLVVDGKEIKVFAIKNPAELPWGELGVDVVIESTGIFEKNDDAKGHIEAGAKRVVISAPSKGESAAPTYVIGANESELGTNQLISNASCTTNCISPIARIVQSKFGILKAGMTTIHAYTATQNLVDGLSDDLRRGRAAAQNIIPTTTGAAISTTLVVPELKGLFDGIAIRVPVISGSLTDFTFLLSRKVTEEEINNAFIESSKEERYKGVLEVTNAPIVSSDIIGNPASAIVDMSMTKVIDGDFVKILAWYDNEWGYSNRLVEMAEMTGRTI